MGVNTVDDFVPGGGLGRAGVVLDDEKAGRTVNGEEGGERGGGGRFTGRGSGTMSSFKNGFDGCKSNSARGASDYEMDSR